MPESALVPQFLKTVAAKHGFKVSDCMYGSIHLGRPSPIEQACGAVYGIWAKSSLPLRAGLKELPGHSGWYAVYWGKDIAPVSRLKAHVQGHKQNGNINLPSIAELSGLSLVFGAIVVSGYERFEQLLHAEYPPLKGTARGGRKATVIKVRSET